MNFLNPEEHQNPISGSKVTVILLKGWHREGSAPSKQQAYLMKKATIIVLLVLFKII